jgi:hypothetical protein
VNNPPSPGGADDTAETEPPYVELAAFPAVDVDRYFGREPLLAGLKARLVSHKLVPVFGASGAGRPGKSL